MTPPTGPRCRVGGARLRPDRRTPEPDPQRHVQQSGQTSLRKHHRSAFLTTSEPQGILAETRYLKPAKPLFRRTLPPRATDSLASRATRTRTHPATTRTFPPAPGRPLPERELAGWQRRVIHLGP